MKSNFVKCLYLFVPAIFLIGVTLSLKYLPILIEDSIVIEPREAELTKAIEQVIYKIEADNHADKDEIIQMLESQISMRKQFFNFITSIINQVDTYADMLLSALLIYLASLYFIYQSWLKKKT